MSSLTENELQDLINRLDAEMPTVHEAVNRVMRDVQAIEKGQKYDDNRGTRYSFRGVDDVINAVGPKLREHGVIIAPWRSKLVTAERYDTKGGARMQNIIVKVTYRITGPRGDESWAESLGQAADMGDKAIPKAMSVAYRVMLLQLLCIPTGEKDPDAENHEAVASNGQSARTAPARPPGTSEQGEWGAVNAQIGEWRTQLGWTIEAVHEHYAKWNKGATLAESTLEDRQRFVQELAAHYMNEKKRQERTDGGMSDAEVEQDIQRQVAEARNSDEPPF